MHEFFTVDGFVEVTESLAEMIKYVANEPSVGLFYVQQHNQYAVPNLINLMNNVMEKSRELTLHTEDLEDSITMVRSMKDCGVHLLGVVMQILCGKMVKELGEKLVSYLNPPLPVSASITTSTLPDAEANELPVSSQIDDELQQELPVDERLLKQKSSSFFL
ncbi:hypothetical protein ACSBR2_038960 [Camellia fascicularis]